MWMRFGNLDIDTDRIVAFVWGFAKGQTETEAGIILSEGETDEIATCMLFLDIGSAINVDNPTVAKELREWYDSTLS